MNMHTILFAALCIFASAITINGDTPFTIRLKEVTAQCAKEHGVELESNMLKNRNDPNADCFRKCLLEKFGALNPDGGLNGEAIVNEIQKFFPNDEDKLTKIKLIVEECLQNEPEEKTCHSAAVAAQCLLAQSIKQGLPIFRSVFTKSN